LFPKPLIPCPRQPSIKMALRLRSNWRPAHTSGAQHIPQSRSSLRSSQSRPVHSQTRPAPSAFPLFNHFRLFAAVNNVKTWNTFAIRTVQRSYARARSSEDLFDDLFEVEKKAAAEKQQPPKKPTTPPPADAAAQAKVPPQAAAATPAPTSAGPKRPPRLSKRKMTTAQRKAYEKRIEKARIAYRKGKEREARAVKEDIKTSIKKLQPLTVLVTKMPVDQAIMQLKWLDKKTAPTVRKLIQQAAASAKSFGMDPSKLIVGTCRPLACRMGSSNCCLNSPYFNWKGNLLNSPLYSR